MRRIFSLFITLQATAFLFAGGIVKVRSDPSWILPVTRETSRIPDLKDVSGGFYYELMSRQVNLADQTVYLHYTRHIINESGVQDASEVSVNFAPQFQQLFFHIVKIIRDGKTINQLNAGSIKIVDEESNASDYEYNGIKRAYLILKGVQKGDLIDVSYSLVGFNPVFDGRYAADFYFNSGTPVANYYLNILAPGWIKLYIKTFNRAVQPTRENINGLTSYQWKNPPLASGSGESNTPSWFTNDPYVSISEYQNWTEVSEWGLRIFNNYQFALPVSLLQKIDSWRKTSAGDQDIFANLALRFVQDQIRYLGLEIGSNTHQPHAPETVYSGRFGDCKDKSLLLTMILRHEHIMAYVALTNSSERENLANAVPSPMAFDHAIVAIPRSSGYVFVDPTISLQRGELINAFIPDYGLALVLKPGENQLTNVEPGSLHSTSITDEFNIRFNNDSSFLKVTSLYRGGAADDIRENLSTSSRQDITQDYLKYYAKDFEGIQSVSPVDHKDDSLKNEVTTEESYTIPKIWHRNEAGNMVLAFYAKSISSRIPDPAAHADSIPLSLDFPFSEEYELHVTMPESWPMDMAAVHIKNDYYQFDFTPVADGNHLSFSYYFKTFKGYIPADDVKKYKTDFKEIENCLSLNFTKFDLSATSSDSKQSRVPASNINWMTVWLSFFLGVLFTMIFRFMNQKTKLQDERLDAAIPLGGWIIFLGVTLMIRMVAQGYYFWNEHYYLASTWNMLEKLGGAKLQAIFVFELIISLFSLAGTGALLFWFFGKRDIFPSMFIYCTLILLIAQFILVLAYYNVPLPGSMISLRQQMLTQFIRMSFYAAIWISFIKRSENVKYTFVYPNS
ncbi:MAG TPA: DUF3857 domain-containing protein [Puia sp.]